MARKKLISEPSSFPYLRIVGISSPLRDYRLAYFINRNAGLSLCRFDDLPVFNEKDGVLYDYSLYSCYQSDQRLHYHLIGNNHPAAKLITLYKHADYFLFVASQPDEDKLDNIIASVKSIPGVQLVFRVNNDTIKNLEGIMSDLELHLVGK